MVSNIATDIFSQCRVWAMWVTSFPIWKNLLASFRRRMLSAFLELDKYGTRSIEMYATLPINAKTDCDSFQLALPPTKNDKSRLTNKDLKLSCSVLRFYQKVEIKINWWNWQQLSKNKAVIIKMKKLFVVFSGHFLSSGQKYRA